MKNDLYTGLLAFTFFNVINFIGAIVNDSLNYYFGINELSYSFISTSFFCLFYFLSTRISMKLRKSLRIPILRGVFWLLNTLPIILNPDGNNISNADAIDLLIPSFCFFVNTINVNLYSFEWIYNTRFDLWGIIVIGVSLYQYLVLEISSQIVFRIQTKK